MWKDVPEDHQPAPDESSFSTSPSNEKIPPNSAKIVESNVCSSPVTLYILENYDLLPSDVKSTTPDQFRSQKPSLYLIPAFRFSVQHQALSVSHGLSR